MQGYSGIKSQINSSGTRYCKKTVTDSRLCVCRVTNVTDWLVSRCRLFCVVQYPKTELVIMLVKQVKINKSM